MNKFLFIDIGNPKARLVTENGINVEVELSDVPVTNACKTHQGSLPLDIEHETCQEPLLTTKRHSTIVRTSLHNTLHQP